MKKLLFLFLFMVFILGGCTDKTDDVSGILSVDEAKAKALDFTQDVLVGPSNKVEAKEIIEDNGLYKITMSVGGKDVDTYMTKDGATFFPQAFDIDVETKRSEDNQNQAAQQAEAQAVEIPKSDKPVVELFVMSHCPYGTQIEKGIIPVVETLGDKIDFQLKFCDYAMHNEVELREQMAQYCIQKDQNDKLLPYLKCFLKDGDSDTCLIEAGVNTSSLDICVKEVDDEYKIMENFADKSTYKGQFPTFNIYKSEVDKYGVSGSPTLVINGTTAKANRDSASLLTAVCNSFSSQPEVCDTAELSSASPAPGFGTGTGGGSDGSCN